MKNLNFNNLDLESPLQRSILIVLIAIAVNTAFVYYGVLPVKSRIQDLHKAIDKSIDRNEHFESVIKTEPTIQKKVAQLQEKHNQLAAEGVLTPLLNSYAMRAKTLVAPFASATDLKIENVKELPAIPLKQPLPLQNDVYRRQPIMFTASGSYTQVAAFVTYVEKELPMTVLSSLQILSQKRSPETHKMSICFEWPVKDEIHLNNENN